MKDKKHPYEQYIKERDKLVSSLSSYRDILRGTLFKRGNICGKEGCCCTRKKNPIFHGPYSYLSHRSKEKTQMIFLNKVKREYASRGIRQYKELIDTIYRISEINFNILRYYYNKIGDKILGGKRQERGER